MPEKNSHLPDYECSRESTFLAVKRIILIKESFTHDQAFH